MRLEAISVPQIWILSLRHHSASAPVLSSELVRAGRALLRWEQKDLVEASGVSLPTVKRLEATPGPLAAHGPTIAALRRALEDAGLAFIPENGGGVGIRFRNRADGTREDDRAMSPENEPKPPASDEAGSDQATEKARRQAAGSPPDDGKPDEGTRLGDLTSENDGGSQG